MYQSALSKQLPPAGPPSAHVVPFRMQPRPDDTIVIEGHLVDGGCPTCGRSRAQHGRLPCREIDLIAARAAHTRLPWWLRLFRRAPEGWR